MNGSERLVSESRSEFSAYAGLYESFTRSCFGMPKYPNDKHAPSNSSLWFGSRQPLARRFVIYLPSRRKNDWPVEDFREVAGAVANLLRKMFGGATTVDAVGYFRDQNEEVCLIESFCSEERWERNSGKLHMLVKMLSRRMDQISIACSLDGEMNLVEPEEVTTEESIGLVEAIRAIESESA